MVPMNSSSCFTYSRNLRISEVPRISSISLHFARKDWWCSCGSFASSFACGEGIARAQPLPAGRQRKKQIKTRGGKRVEGEGGFQPP